ncbi:MAG TPA: DUF5985 family protein [Gemmataceae bacterium]|jgi:hypothetical protein
MEGIIYLLCATTALTCCLLMLRGYRHRHVRLLLWGSFCFLALTVENLILFVDLVLIPETDLSAFHLAAAMIGVGILAYGLIWEVK